MGDILNIPKPLSQTSSPPPPPPPPPQSPPPQKSNLTMLYYGLVVVATAAIVLAIYNLIIVRWCATQYHRSRQESRLFGRRRRGATRNNRPHILTSQPSPSLSRGGSTVSLVSSFRYKKGGDGGGSKHQLDYDDTECSVCLSVFEEGEEVKELPRCNHSFHASCIDMWLYSHVDCPLCRAPVVELPPSQPLSPTPPTPPALHRHTESAVSEHSRDGLLDQFNSSV